MRADCIVVGGGVIGMLSAWELAKSGFKVVLLERHRLGQEASWAGAGILGALPPWSVPSALEPLLHWSQLRYPALARELHDLTGIDCEWMQSGLLVFDAALNGVVSSWARPSRYRCEVVGPAELQALEPRVHASDQALRWPSVAQIRNPRLLRALAAVMRQIGVGLYENAQVFSVIVAHNRVLGANSNAGRFLSESVIIAGGAWSGQLLAKLPFPPALVPVRGQMLLFETQTPLFRHILTREGVYAVPRADGHVLIGSTVEHTGFDKSVTSEARSLLEAGAFGLVPELQKSKLSGHWAGLRPYVQRDTPIIAAHPEIRGLYANTGHFRLGVTLAPGSARLLADLILMRSPIVDREAFAWPAPDPVRCDGASSRS
ncbi:MAG: glycine oxidase ThiO [Gammaproteobacteria bacterium]